MAGVGGGQIEVGGRAREREREYIFVHGKNWKVPSTGYPPDGRAEYHTF